MSSGRPRSVSWDVALGPGPSQALGTRGEPLEDAEQIVTVFLQLRGSNAPAAGELIERGRLCGGDAFEMRIVEDDVGGNLVPPCGLAAPCPKCGGDLVEGGLPRATQADQSTFHGHLVVPPKVESSAGSASLDEEPILGDLSDHSLDATVEGDRGTDRDGMDWEKSGNSPLPIALTGLPRRPPRPQHWFCTEQFSAEPGRIISIGDYDDPTGAPGHRHMEYPPLLLQVLRQAVGKGSLLRSDHDDERPFPALHAVHRRQRHALGITLEVEDFAQPRLEGPRVGVQGGDLLQRREVVEMRGTVGLAP